MITLSTIKNLVSKLKKDEVKSLLDYLIYYQGIKDDAGSKGRTLIELVVNDPDCTAKDAQFALYGKENYHAFNKLLNRVKDKIYEVMLFDQNLSKPYYSNRNKVVFDIRKKLVQSEVLLLRGMTDDLESLQNKIILKAKEYEIYDSLIEALQAKQRFMVLKRGRKSVEQIDKEILQYEESRKAVQRARNLFTVIGSKINVATSWIDYKDDLTEAIKVLKEDNEKINSATVAYFLGYLETEYFQNIGNYPEAEDVLQKIKSLLRENVSVYTDARLADVLVNLSNNELHLHEFENAISNSEEAQKYYSAYSDNFYVAREIEFFAHYYNGEIEEAEKIIEEIYNASRSSNTPFLYSKRAYLFACIKTIKGEIEKSNELLQEVKEIEKDKEGWNLSKRVLTIINRIEEKDFESADLKVMSLQKFIKRILKFRHVRRRDILILRILHRLINDGFDFEKTYQSRKRYFDLLESNDSDHGWKIKSPEVIVFHKWYRAKMGKKRYRFGD